MTAQPAVRVEGLSKVIRQIKSIEPALVDDLKAENRVLADDVTDTARRLVPRRSGRLASNIRPGATARTGIVRAGGRGVPYAGPIHFGWARRNIQPDPFLYDALDERRDEVERAYLQAITRICERIDG